MSITTDGVKGNAPSYAPVISQDGRFVAFYSLATNLKPNDRTGTLDLFVKDTQTDTLTSVAQITRNIFGSYPTIAAFRATGDHLVFVTNNQVFVANIQANTTYQVSTNAAGASANNESSQPSISADGRFVVFASSADNLIANDVNSIRDVFVKDLSTGQIVRVPKLAPNGSSIQPKLSSDGRFVFFTSTATNLSPSDFSSDNDVFKAANPLY